MLHVSYSFIISFSDNATVKAIRWTSSWHKPFFPWRNIFNSGQKEVVKHVYLPFSVTCLYDLCFRKRNIEKIVEKQFIWREVTWKNVPRHTIVKGGLFSFVPKLSKKIAYFKVKLSKILLLQSLFPSNPTRVWCFLLIPVIAKRGRNNVVMLLRSGKSHFSSNLQCGARIESFRGLNSFNKKSMIPHHDDSIM